MLTDFKLSSEEFTKLNYERYHYPCPVVQKKLHCLFIKASHGLSNSVIGKLMDAHLNSIREWVNTYKQGGFDAIIKVGYGTNTSAMEQNAASIIESST